jgi:hypothetical protein
MASFTTRVELHGGTWEDYAQLHNEMADQGFTNTITADDGVTYQLPPAEYNFVGPVDRSTVFSRAKYAAGRVKKSYAVLVSESVGRTWYGLQAIRRAA